MGAEVGGALKNRNSFQNAILKWCRRAGIQHRGGACGTPRTCKGIFSAHTQPLRDLYLSEEDIRVADAQARLSLCMALVGRLLESPHGPLVALLHSSQVKNYSPGYMEQAPSRGHEASLQSGLDVG